MNTAFAFNVRIDHDPAPIRHIAVQCPECMEWFRGRDITEESLTYDSDLYQTTFVCPICHTVFGKDTNYWICSGKEADYPEIYDDCWTKETRFSKPYDEPANDPQPSTGKKKLKGHIRTMK